MKEFFTTTIGAWDDGSVRLTAPGIAVVVVIIALLVVVAAVIRHRNAEKKTILTTKQLVYSAVAIALAVVCSMIKFANLPMGGSVTLFSMLFIALIGYWYGPEVGLMSGFAYGFLEFAQDGGSYILSPMQACMDYIFAFAALGLSGFFYQKKNGLIKGYILAILVRGLFHTIGGYLYWMDYMPDNFPKSLAAIYPIVYNYSYILAEAVITLIVISLPPVKKALVRVGMMARE